MAFRALPAHAKPITSGSAVLRQFSGMSASGQNWGVSRIEFAFEDPTVTIAIPEPTSVRSIVGGTPREGPRIKPENWNGAENVGLSPCNTGMGAAPRRAYDVARGAQ